ncbi:MAG: T9SS type A sorting domain-containing protein, partial [bacterium]|nr:T9SS type A sorting domain-containing protein [bacterium]
HTISLPMGGAAVVESQSAMDTFGKVSNHPNPFNPATTISYQLLHPGEVSLVIYNALGQQVRALVQSRQNFGTYQVTWDGKDALGHSVSTGVYFYRLISNSTVQTHRMLLLK